MIKKTIYLNEKQVDDLVRGFEVEKVIRIKNFANIKLIIRNNGEWGIEKP